MRMDQMKRWLGTVFAAAFITVLSSGSAFGIIFAFNGTSSADGRPQKGTAEFTTTSTSLTITLTNTANPVGGISSVFDGISFTFAAAPTSLTLTGVTSTNGIVNCGGGSCSFTAGPTSDNTTFYGWGSSGALGSPLLAAGGGSYKPYGVVNSSIITTDGIPNAQHNPYLNGPVTFVFSVGGWTEPGSITAATAIFGTAGETQRGVPVDTSTQVPEPATAVLLASGLLPLLRRRRKA
jgi:hypothetical protein